MMQRKLLVCVLNLVRIASLQLALQRNRGSPNELLRETCEKLRGKMIWETETIRAR